MEPSQNEQLPSQPRSFAPFIAKTFQIKGYMGINIGLTSYNEKHNLIIICSRDSSLQFYDATTLEPSERFQTEKLQFSALGMSFCPKTETFLLADFRFWIYSYNLSSKTLKTVLKHTQSNLTSITMISSRSYVFGTRDSHRIYVGDLEKGEVVNFKRMRSDALSLCCSEKRKLLFSSLACGSLRVYRTDQLPKLPVMSSVRGFSHYDKSDLRKIQSIIVNGKEYIITTGSDCPIRIWHLSKGKVKLLKVIHTKERVYDMVYLEDYKIFATSHRALSFLKFPSGKLESKYTFTFEHCRGIFLMKDKNALGVTDLSANKINIVKLSPE